MTDRELLEKAAKAAGIEVEWGIVEGGKTLAPPSDAYLRDKYGIRWKWDPLTDDGDALRLAVKLDLHLGIETHAVSVWPANGFGMFCTENAQPDKDAATRRAIVRAAAAMGGQQ